MTKSFNKKGMAVAVILSVMCVAVLTLWLAAQPVLAHANLASSEPAANSVLDESPERVVLRFTEPLEPQFSQVQVLDSEGQQVDNGDSTVDSNDPRVMSLTLPELADGLYTVVWRNVSTVDGHSVRGAFSFSVGQPIAGDVAQPVEPETPLLQSPSEPVLRWLVLLGALTIAGGLGLGLIVLGPVFSRMESSPAVDRLTDRLAARMRWLVWIATWVLLIASLGQLIVQASVIFQVPVFSATGGPALSVLTDTGWGHVWLWRIGLLAAVVGVLLALALVNRPLTSARGGEVASTRTKARGFLETLALGLGMGVLFTLSLTSHAAATPNIATAALFNDYLHLLAVAFWVGGLFQLALAVPLIIGSLSGAERRDCLSALVPRFSGMAALSVGVLVVTGLYSAWAQVTVIPALATPYGFTLIAKIALVVPLLLLGALNLLWVKPRLKDGSGRSAGWLRRIVSGEVGLALLVLLSVGFLTSIEPARQVASREGIGQQDLSFQDTVEGTEMMMVEPGQVGPNEFVVNLEDRLGNPIDNATDVRLRVAYLGEDLGEQPVSAENAGGGRYVLHNGVISIAGPWQVEVLVQRPDAFDARTAFRFEVSPGGAAGGSAAIAPSEDTSALLLGLELVVLGVLFLGMGIPMGGWYRRAGAAVMAPGVAAVLVGALLVANTQMGSQDTAGAEVNPIPPTSESIAMGRQLYQENCQSCHGASGRGNGPAAEGLDPPPADLTVHVPLHPDSNLFGFIHDGIKGTAMPALGDTLTDEEIWHIVNYIRTLE